MDLESAKREIEAAVKGAPVTLQINRAASHLTIVMNRQRKELSEEFDYKALAEKILAVLRAFDLGEVKTIKFYGREPSSQPEWQWVTAINSAPQNTATQKAANKVHLQTEDKLLVSSASVNASIKSKEPLGWFLFAVGIGMMGIGLVYDPTVSSGGLGLERTYNIGAINIKSTYTNTGGFTAVCGAIFATCSRGQRANDSVEKKGSKAGNA